LRLRSNNTSDSGEEDYVRGLAKALDVDGEDGGRSVDQELLGGSGNDHLLVLLLLLLLLFVLLGSVAAAAVVLGRLFGFLVVVSVAVALMSACS
jgi:hypothetical protein